SYYSYLSPSSIVFFSTLLRPPTPPLFPYTTLFRSAGPSGPARRKEDTGNGREALRGRAFLHHLDRQPARRVRTLRHRAVGHGHRSEEHTSELQSLTNLVCRLLLEKKKTN